MSFGKLRTCLHVAVLVLVARESVWVELDVLVAHARTE